MIAIAFIVFWIVLGLVLFLLAMRRGPRRAQASTSVSGRRSGRLVGVLILAAYLAFGIAVPALVLAGNHDDNQISSEDITLTAAQEKGRELFGQYCNQCHTLAAAKTVGRVGPNFDQLRPSYAIVADAVTNGRMRGNGTMPAGLVAGGDVRDVACFVDQATHPDQSAPKQCRGAAKSAGSGGSSGGGGGRTGSPEG